MSLSPNQSILSIYTSSILSCRISIPVKTIGVIGIGVIGRSWISLALYNGIKVLASDPFLDASSLPSLLEPSWQSLEALKGAKRIPLENLEFVADIFPRLKEVDYVQEVGFFKSFDIVHLLTSFDIRRMVRRK